VLRARLAAPRLDALRQRFLVTDHIDGLTAEEVPQYIQKRMEQAGWQGETPFDAEALQRIQLATGGNPRQINILCERLLTQAYVEEKTRVSVQDVDNTLQDMEDEWRTSGDEPPVVASTASSQLREQDRRLDALEAALNQISQVTNTILVRLDALRQE
jgi:ATPase